MKDVFGNKVSFAPIDNIDKYPDEVGEILCEIFTKPNEVWVSDMSSINDFPLDEAAIETIAFNLGIPIKGDDLLWQVAERLHLHRAN